MNDKTKKFIKQFLNYANLYSATGWSLFKDNLWIIYQSKPHQFRALMTNLNLKAEPHFRVMLDLNHKSLSWIDERVDLFNVIDDTRYLSELEPIKSVPKKYLNYLKREKKWLSKSEYSFYTAIYNRSYSVLVVKFRHKNLPFKGLWVLGLERDYA